ncbi:MAG: malate dehydrogenase (quinone) [Betaproteobacteria bacterium HGW-Betaproteobacteria-22]|nr:MAG: malate dehydrogenase (quinone) [Betaproteobacteria bacterium HGW-Betaproteobacteria-22]
MTNQKVDILVVGSGIMSATLATLLNALDPKLSIRMVERLTRVAAESTDAWNNAGTGHAGYCELNYTPINADGEIEINRALAINASFEISLQLWSSLVEQSILPAPEHFINPTPHLSFVWGEDNVAFLKKRYQLLKAHHLFADMEFSDDFNTLKQWMPLMMNARDTKQKVAATRVAYGTDIDFGSLTRSLVEHLSSQAQFKLDLHTEVKKLKQLENGHWQVTFLNKQTKKTTQLEAGFVFLGAGGGALKLLQKSGIPESKGYGGFPVSGQWLVCHDPAIINQHHCKVYGKAAIGAPPMSVPHLDTRVIHGQKALLYGPYAGFTTKFLKQGSFLDLLQSVALHNLKPMLSVARYHGDLTRYLIGEAMQSPAARLQTLRQYYPEAKANDWALAHAGKRVQIIKKCSQKGGRLEFGTEVVTSHNGNIAALLGASPGASVSVQAMLSVIERCFKQQLQTQDWQQKLKTLIPSYGESLIDNKQLSSTVRKRNLATLKLGT